MCGQCCETYGDVLQLGPVFSDFQIPRLDRVAWQKKMIKDAWRQHVVCCFCGATWIRLGAAGHHEEFGGFAPKIEQNHKDDQKDLTERPARQLGGRRTGCLASDGRSHWPVESRAAVVISQVA